MTKRELTQQTFDEIGRFHEVWKQLFQAVEDGKLPGMTFGCNIDYHREQFYKMIKYPKRYRTWQFEYHLNNIKDTVRAMEDYLETGLWRGNKPKE